MSDFDEGKAGGESEQGSDEGEQELRFTRCPKCRSLVPVVPEGCRMCGGILELTPQSDSGNPKG